MVSHSGESLLSVLTLLILQYAGSELGLNGQTTTYTQWVRVHSTYGRTRMHVCTCARVNVCTCARVHVRTYHQSIHAANVQWVLMLNMPFWKGEELKACTVRKRKHYTKKGTRKTSTKKAGEWVGRVGRIVYGSCTGLTDNTTDSNGLLRNGRT